MQPHSGANANMAAFLALLSPGDKVMGMRLDQGGHLTHGSPVNFSGKIYDFVAYGVDDETERLDYDRIRDLATAERPKPIVAGATAYPRSIDFDEFRSIADDVGALLIVDAAHIAGLIAGGAHPSPVPHADVVTFTTHKTLRGPRAGTHPVPREHAAAIDKAVFPGLQGGPLMHVIAAKAVAFKLAAQPEFASYAAQIVANAAALAAGLADEGFRIVSGGTDNHLMLVDLRPFGVTGKVAQEALDVAGITCNKNAIPNDPEKPFVTSGLRLGTASVTTAGMGEDEMAEVARTDRRVLRAPDGRVDSRDVREQANRLCASSLRTPTWRIPDGRLVEDGWVRARPRGFGGVDLPALSGRAPSRGASGRGQANLAFATSTPRRSRNSVGPRCSSGSSPRWWWPRRCPSSTRCSRVRPSRSGSFWLPA